MGVGVGGGGVEGGEEGGGGGGEVRKLPKLESLPEN